MRYCASRGNRILGMIFKSFKNLDLDTLRLLYTSLVRPHLEFAVSSWCPYLKKYIHELEKVQKRATRTIPSIRNFDYKTRLKQLNLMDLETRRLRGDLIQMFKIVNSYEMVHFCSDFKCIIRQNIKYCLQRYNFFKNRVVNVWNALPQVAINAVSINVFKARLDEWLSGQCPKKLKLLP